MDLVRRHRTLFRRLSTLNHNISQLEQSDLTARLNHAQNSNRDTTSKPLHNRLIALKDNICTTNADTNTDSFRTTAASATLKNFTSPFEATVVKLLRQNGAIIAAKTNMDEFGMGSHSLHSFFGLVVQAGTSSSSTSSSSSSGALPGGKVDDGVGRSAGGSSGGSAVSVMVGESWAALGTDTGGSVRLPAAFTGIAGFKPSYGLISRWGVIAYANSLDTVGILARRVDDVRTVFDVLNSMDDQDPTNAKKITRERLSRRRKELRKKEKIRIGFPREYNIQDIDPHVHHSWCNTLKHLQQLGHTVRPISLPSTKQALSAYYVLAPAEASSNLAKYDGVRYGTRPDGPDGSSQTLYAKTRGECFGDETKRRILLGTYNLSSNAMENYFIQAQKVRRVVQQDFDRVFGERNPLLDCTSENDMSVDVDDKEYNDERVDVILTPTTPNLPPTIESLRGNDAAVREYTNDVFTVPASLAGLPALSVPATKFAPVVDAEEGSNIGMQIIGQYGSDHRVLEVGKILEDLK